MSHNVQITGVKINDLDSLGAACAELRREGINVSLDRGTPGARGLTFRTYQYVKTNDPRADHVIRLADCKYDIGLLQQPGGHYNAIYDDNLGMAYAPCPIACDITNPDDVKHGAGMAKLMQRYTAIVTEKAARARGFAPRRVYGADGRIEVVITV